MAATMSCDLKSNRKKGILNFHHHSPVVMSWRRVDLTTCGRIPRREDSLPELELTENFGVTAHPKPSCLYSCHLGGVRCYDINLYFQLWVQQTARSHPGRQCGCCQTA